MVRMIHRGLAWTTAGLLTGLLASGCPDPGSFHCQSDDQCLFEGQQGSCTVVGYCAFADELCSSGWAYGELSTPELAGTCVPLGDGSGDGDGSTTGASTSSSTTSTTGPDPTTIGPADGSTGLSDCSPGEPCETSDPCDAAGVCVSAGVCIPVSPIQCSSPPGPCYVPSGECTPEGCVYDPLPWPFPCSDGDPCTQDDVCDGNGECVPGPSCESEHPCQIGSCTPEGCVFEELPDGSPCGAHPSNRCCGGRCDDISLDEEHCGGCYLECTTGEDCESIADTPMCEQNDAHISGRCTCETTDDCPSGQTCVETGAYPGRCEPNEASDCPGNIEVSMLCPNFCTY